MLKKIIIEKDEKNSILSENNALLKEKIRYLELNKSSNSAAISQRKTESQNVATTSMQKSTTSVAHATSEAETKSKKRDGTKDSNKVSNETIKNMQQQQEKIMNSVINLANDTTTLQDKETGWRTADRKKSKKKQNTILGEATDDASTIKAVPRMGYLHVYRLQPHTTTSELDKCIKSKSINDAKCTQLASKYPQEYSSFKVSFPISQLDLIQKPDFWPEGVRVNRFFHQPPWKKPNL